MGVTTSSACRSRLSSSCASFAPWLQGRSSYLRRRGQEDSLDWVCLEETLQEPVMLPLLELVMLPLLPMMVLRDLLTGVTTVLPIADIAALMGINTDPVPSPFSDPLGFVMHPLVTPIIMAAITFNIPALALAQGALAGNLIITHLLTIQAQG